MGVNFGQNLFFSTGRGTIASYDAFDITQGVGYVTFYGGMTQDASGGKVYKLSPIKFYSEMVATSGALTNSGNLDLTASKAFICQFVKQQTIGGKTVVNIPIGNQSGAGIVPTTVAEISFFKVKPDGTKDTIGIRTSGALYAGFNDFTGHMSAIPIEIVETVLKKGDTLRMDVAVWTKSSAIGGNTAQGWLGHDPLNRTSSGAWIYDPSIMSILIPFKIDI